VIRTPSDEIQAEAVVLAHGLLNVPKQPPAARDVSPRVLQLHASDFRSADELPTGGVLVVGGGQSGCQIAEDLAVAGRAVSLATCRVGRYNWSYRGRETFQWLDDLGYWAQRPGELADPSMMRMPQPLIASGGRTLSLPLLVKAGVRLLGRLKGVQGERVELEGSASAHAGVGDDFWQRTTGLIDAFIDERGLDVPPREGDEGGGPVPSDGATSLDLADADIATVIWCSGFTGDLSFTDLPLTGRDGLRHDGQASFVPGVWFQGFPWLTQRRSGILYGFPADAAVTADAITRHLTRQVRQPDPPS
jgi:putative flavoprotein involved in K+ transport